MKNAIAALKKALKTKHTRVSQQRVKRRLADTDSTTTTTLSVLAPTTTFLSFSIRISNISIQNKQTNGKGDVGRLGLHHLTPW